MVFKKNVMVESLLFLGAGVGAGEQILGAGAGQKWTGSTTLLPNTDIFPFTKI